MSDFRKGNGAAWLDFLATRIGRYREEQIEMLPDPKALQRWLSEQDLAPSTAPNEQDLRRAWVLREALHAAVSSTLKGTLPSPAALSAIEWALRADKPLHIRPSKSGVRTVQPRARVRAHRERARAKRATNRSGSR